MSRDIDLDDVIEDNQPRGNGGGDGHDFDNDDFDDRGGFQGGKERRHRGLKGFLAVMLFLAAALAFAIFWQNWGGSGEQTEDEPDSSPETRETASRYRFAPLPPTEEKVEPEPEPIVESQVPPLVTQQQGMAQRPGMVQQEEAAPTPEELAMQRRLSGFGDIGQSAQNAADGSGSGSAGGGTGQQASEGSRAFFQKLNSGEVSRAFATRLANPSLTIPQGDRIPCGTTTELDTTVPGMVGCIVSQDVYSADRTVRLIDKGAQVTGLVGSGIQHGQNRVFVAWNRLRNPDNVVINLDSSGTGSLGAAGVDGYVDTHFWERFGGAILMSVIADAGDAAVQSLADNASESNTNINLNNTTSTVDELAQEALSATIDIPPTLKANQGKPVMIYVAQDLDFSGVYDLEYR